MDPSRLSTTRDAGQVLELKCAGLKILNKALSDGSSSCMMGSEGFSFCDTEHLWWRLVRKNLVKFILILLEMTIGLTGIFALCAALTIKGVRTRLKRTKSINSFASQLYQLVATFVKESVQIHGTIWNLSHHVVRQSKLQQLQRFRI